MLAKDVAHQTGLWYYNQALSHIQGTKDLALLTTACEIFVRIALICHDTCMLRDALCDYSMGFVHFPAGHHGSEQPAVRQPADHMGPCFSAGGP